MYDGNCVFSVKCPMTVTIRNIGLPRGVSKEVMYIQTKMYDGNYVYSSQCPMPVVMRSIVTLLLRGVSKEVMYIKVKTMRNATHPTYTYMCQ